MYHGIFLRKQERRAPDVESCFFKTTLASQSSQNTPPVDPNPGREPLHHQCSKRDTALPRPLDSVRGKLACKASEKPEPHRTKAAGPTCNQQTRCRRNPHITSTTRLGSGQADPLSAASIDQAFRVPPARKNGRRNRWFHRAQLLGRHPLTPRSPDREITLALPSIDAITGKHKDMREVHRILTAILATVFTRYFTNGCNLEDNGNRIQVQPSNR